MRILLVDDETLARDRLRRMLSDDERHEIVGEAGNGLEAVRLTEDVKPDLVLLDIRMPGMDGLETARHFLELDEPPAVIFCTAYEEHAIQAFDLQAVGYLLKPVRKDNLVAALGKTVRLNSEPSRGTRSLTFIRFPPCRGTNGAQSGLGLSLFASATHHTSRQDPEDRKGAFEGFLRGHPAPFQQRPRTGARSPEGRPP